MSDSEAKRSRIKDKIAASQARLQRESNLPATRPKPPEAGPPESYRSLAGEYPWLSVAGGLAAGLLIGALLPKAAGSKLGKRALGFATVAAELGMAFSKQARHATVEAANDGASKLGKLGHRIDDGTADLRGRTRDRASKAAGSARSTGQRVVREALRLASSVRK